MSQFIPSTTVAIFRKGTIPAGLDVWENEVPPTSPTADQADVKDRPALLTEFSRRVWQPAEGRADTVAMARCRLRPGAVSFELTPEDRVLDQRSGRYYAVDEVPLPGSTAQVGDIRLVLRRVS